MRNDVNNNFVCHQCMCACTFGAQEGRKEELTQARLADIAKASQTDCSPRIPQSSHPLKQRYAAAVAAAAAPLLLLLQLLEAISKRKYTPLHKISLCIDSGTHYCA
jgi:hypothetical protein